MNLLNYIVSPDLKEKFIFEIRSEKDSTWVKFIPHEIELLGVRCYQKNEVDWIIFPKKSFKDSFSIPIYKRAPNFSTENYFHYQDPGKYLLRVTFISKNNAVIGNTTLFSVKEYSGIDLEAYHWLLSLPIPHFLYDEYLTGDPNYTFTKKNAEEILKRFENSRFSPYAKYYLLLYNLKPTKDSKGNIIEADYFKLRTIANSLLVNKNITKGFRNKIRNFIQQINRIEELWSNYKNK